MAIQFSKFRVAAFITSSCLLSANAWAAGPSVEDVLRFQPIQRDAQIDRPEAAAVAQCTLKAEKIGPKSSAWVVRDGSGQILRNFVDTNGDNTVDQWSYYKDGLEVYRDIDSNFNKKADQCRWLNTGGARWGIDKNEDGKIDSWKEISAEEVTAELVAALRDRDRVRFERLLLTPAEVKSLGVGPAKSELLIKKIDMAPAQFKKLADSQNVVSEQSKWVSFGGNPPGAVPAGTEGSTADLTVYENVAAMVETEGKAQAVNVGTMVKVDNVWRLIDVPQMTEDAVAENESRGFFYGTPRSDRPGAADVVGKPSKAVEEIMEKLNKLGDLANDRTEKQRDQRADLLEELAKVTEGEMRVNSYHQLADTLSAAVQQGEYKAGIDRLKRIADALKADPADEALALYVQFRYLTADHSQALITAPPEQFANIQTKWVEDLEAFLKDAKKYPDSADAMLELAICQEIAGDEEKSIQWYDAITKDYPESTANRKAQGAKLRMQSVGKPIPLKGTTLAGKPFDLNKDMKGKAVLIQYWATWCEPCKADMPLLMALRNRFGKNGFEVVGVCLDTNKKEMKDYLQEQELPWTQLFEEGGMDSPLSNQLGVQTLPTMILTDKEGKVVNRNIKAQDLEAELKKILK